MKLRSGFISRFSPLNSIRAILIVDCSQVRAFCQQWCAAQSPSDPPLITCSSNSIHTTNYAWILPTRSSVTTKSSWMRVLIDRTLSSFAWIFGFPLLETRKKKLTNQTHSLGVSGVPPIHLRRCLHIGLSQPIWSTSRPRHYYQHHKHHHNYHLCSLLRNLRGFSGIIGPVESKSWVKANWSMQAKRDETWKQKATSTEESHCGLQ